MIVIYTPKVTNRIRYVLDFVFKEHLGIAYELTENADADHLPENLYLSYTNRNRNGWYSVYQDSLLLEGDIHPQKIFVSRENGFPVFFQTTDTYDCRFDIFSCIFYLLSRYEEYLPHERDIHGRYLSSNSILAKKEFDFSPVIDIWLEFLRKELAALQPALNFRQYSFEYMPTFDIDNAFRFLGRNWIKHPPDILKMDAFKTLLQLRKDPFDTYDFILEECSKNTLQPFFFFLLSDENANDSRVSPSSRSLQQRIRFMRDMGYVTGIHPSYRSLEIESIGLEKALLESIIGEPVLYSRQHFLRICFPDYFRAISKVNIRHDFSLLYPDTVGFRAGYSRSFFFFDLLKNEATQLMLHSTCWMDATFEYYRTEKNEEIQQKINQLLQLLMKNNAKLVTLFHNDLLCMEKYRGLFCFFNQHTKLRE
ncbi:MAG: hypothetical protein IPM95_10900 [Sphingobacteriales bacterium]|nr:hypothetical protein [Sphingobacteriales bacterium]